jgi:hypothetical protein
VYVLQPPPGGSERPYDSRPQGAIEGPADIAPIDSMQTVGF